MIGTNTEVTESQRRTNYEQIKRAARENPAKVVNLDEKRDPTTVEVRDGKLHEARDKLISIMRRADHGMMLHGERIVRAEEIERQAIGGGVTRSLELREVSAAEFTAACGKAARFNKAAGKPCDCPAKLSASIYDSPPSDLLPRVERLAETPLLLPDNTIMNVGLFRGALIRAPEIRSPDFDDDAEAALERVLGYLAEFEFKEERDRSAAVCLLLTAALRASLPQCPAFFITKPLYGAGASTLAKLAGIIATGRVPALLTSAEEMKELDKAIGAALIAGRSVLALDNLPEGRELKSAILPQAISEPLIEVRELGFSRNHVIGAGPLILLTGVNIAPAKDLQRRMIKVELAPTTESPESRVYLRPTLLEDAIGAREELLADLFHIAISYRDKGPVSPLAGFQIWAQHCVAPLVALGLADPIAELHERAQEDPVRQVLEMVISKTLGREFTARQLTEIASTDTELAAAMVELLGKGKKSSDELDSNTVGYFLKRVAGRWVGHRCLRREKRSGGMAKYSVHERTG